MLQRGRVFLPFQENYCTNLIIYEQNLEKRAMQKSYLVVTVIGPDKRGIVANVTEAVIQTPPELSSLNCEKNWKS